MIPVSGISAFAICFMIFPKAVQPLGSPQAGVGIVDLL